jgi:hypothetical protein
MELRLMQQIWSLEAALLHCLTEIDTLKMETQVLTKALRHLKTTDADPAARGSSSNSSRL